MAYYQYTKTIDSDQLKREIENANLGEPEIERVGTTVNIYFPSALSEADQTALASLVAAHTPPSPTLESVKATIRERMDYGNAVLIDFAAENVLLGIVADGQNGVVLDKMFPVIFALKAGALLEAIARIKAISILQYDVKYVTANRLLALVNKIEDHLGIPLSESL